MNRGWTIEGARHPVVERVLDDYMPNDCLLDGPAHADHHRPQHGRQIDLHALDRAHRAARLLRQLRAGSAAQPGPVDRILTRIGAADDLAAAPRPFWWR